MKPLRLIELFAGIGSQAKALKNLDIPFETHRVIEWDKHAINSYNAIHNTNFETQDITKIRGEDLGITDTNKYDYLLTYSFPCQDLSNAGRQKGMSKGDNTRSGLLWEVERLLNETNELPQYLLMENVPEVIGQKNNKDFALWVSFLEGKGYKNYYQVLNAKDYGIPQNRERCFMVSFLDKRLFTFPKPVELKLRLKDLLEKGVDEKYYLSEAQIRQIKSWNAQQDPLENAKTKDDEVIQTITAKSNTSMNASMLLIKEEPKILQLGHGYNKGGQYDLCPSITTSSWEHNNFLYNEMRFRKVTPLECYRLMGFGNEDFYRASQVNSNTQLYRQAGNSIVVNVLMAIFNKMFIDTTIENYQTSIFDFINKEEKENEKVF